MKTKQKSFTLIELMVVISIIGLLSSIILVFLSNAKQKAKIATGLTFSSLVKNVVGIENVGEWSFDGNLNDTFSGYNNNGTWVGGGSPSYVESAHPSLGTALSFDGNHYIQIPASLSLYPRTDLAVTIEALVKINSFPASLPYNVVIYRPDYFGLFLDTNSLEFVIWGDGGTVQFGPFGIQNTGKWYHVVATFIPPSKILLYLDGIKVFSTIALEFEPFLSYNFPLYIGGCSGCGYGNFNGLIDNIRVYYEPMPD